MGKSNKGVIFLKKVYRLLSRTTLKVFPFEHYYLRKSEFFRRQQMYNESIEILIKGDMNRPNNYKLNIELAKIFMNKQEWDKAYRYWKKAFKNKKRNIPLEIFLGLATSLKMKNNYKKSKQISQQGLDLFPNAIKLKLNIVDIAFLEKKFSQALLYLEEITKNYNGNPPAHIYLKISLANRKLNNLDEAKEVIEKSISEYPDSQKLLNEYSQVLIKQYKWKEAKLSIEDLITRFPGKATVKEYMSLAVINQILGNHKQAEDIFLGVFNHPNYYDKNKKTSDFLKFTLFDNGESRIEFYKQVKRTTTVCVTFDSINITWNQKSFGFDFLLKQGVDILAVRKKEKNTYQQDLSLEDFYSTTNKLVQYYSKKVAYGFSLGGYSSLYYGASIGCDILSLSPRNSAHPIYGKLPDEEFNHTLSHKVNVNLSPVIAYDPKNSMDKRYIENDLKDSYPNAIFLKFPYVGHRIAPFFLHVGILQDIVRRIINGDTIPNYKNVPKKNSHQYLRVLGNECLRRKKYKWAFSLGKRAVELAPNNKPANRLKIRSLLSVGKYTEALYAAKFAYDNIPKSNDFKSLFIDTMLKANLLLNVKQKLKDDLIYYTKLSEPIKFK